MSFCHFFNCLFYGRYLESVNLIIFLENCWYLTLPCLYFITSKQEKQTLPLRCFGSCLQRLTTWPCMRTGSCRASRAISSWETGPMDAREWSLSRDTPSSSHLVCWQGPLKVADRLTWLAWILTPSLYPLIWIYLDSRLDPRRLHSWGHAGVWGQHPAQFQHSHAAHHPRDRE